MLSRVAERVYWLARYIERAENTARLATVHAKLMFDLPKSVNMSWYDLVKITDSEAYFDEHFAERSEQNCMAMLLTDSNNPASLVSSLKWARENIRTTRDILPREAWIHINELYLMVNQEQEDLLNRKSRNALLSKVIRSCQAFSGMLSGTMSHNQTYSFFKMGVLMERADMTTRLIDEGGLFVSQQTIVEEDSNFQPILWAHLLRAIGSYFMYRQHYQTEISGQEVLEFLTQDEQFARSVNFCLQAILKITEKLPNAELIQSSVSELVSKIEAQKSLQIGTLELHNHLDWIQRELNLINDQLYDVWFNPREVA